MAIIPLRQYNREIEGMIDSGQIDEAIAHCRHILQTYPKYIQTYRLLGKSHLESQRYTDGSDIFQRLLAVVPDDFVSHVGMSIIREDENNLDAAIWHMERAFETQPSNAAIQEELRRLYGRRDGIEPPKIRLTRGALARMYARGNLYEQAIAEVRSALSEDPQRVDLQVLLAQMYHHAGQRVESIDICNNIVKKYPYCFEANRLLVVTLPDINRTADTEEYRQRLIALDPYFANASPKAINSDDVPENAVTIERLDYRPGQPVSGAPEGPAWASSLGVAFEKESSEQLPEWLQSDENPALTLGEERAPATAAPLSLESPQEQTTEPLEIPPQEEIIPDWMQEAGWQPAKGEATEGPAISDLEESEAEINKGEIPDWLKEMAPPGVLDEELPPLGEDDSEIVLPWLQEKEPEQAAAAFPWLDENKLEAEPTSDVEPTASNAEVESKELFHQEAASIFTEPAVEPAPEEEASSPPDLTDQNAALAWLEALAVHHGAKEEELITKPEERLETPPDWVQEQGPAESIPSAPSVEEPIIPAAEVTPEQVEAPDWLQDITPLEAAAAIAAVEGVERHEEPEESQLPEWLREMPPSEELTPPAEIAPPLASLEEVELPEWLRETTPAEAGAPEQAAEGTAPPEDIQRAELPDWLLEMVPAEADLTAAAAETPEKPEGAEEAGLPDWLSELEPKDEEISSELLETPAEISEEISAVPQEMETVVPESAPPAEEPIFPSAPELEDQNAALAWLESLAIQHGAKEEELITKPEDRLETPPDWVQESAELPVSSEEVAPELTSEEIELPSWLEETESTAADDLEALSWLDEEKAISVEPTASTEELPSWLQEEAPEEAVPAPGSDALAEPTADVELPAWLQEMAEEEAATEVTSGEPVTPASVDEVPSWLQEIIAEESAPEPVGEALAETAPTDEVPAWLQEMAVEEAVEEEATPEPVSEVPFESAPSVEIPAWEQEETVVPPVEQLDLNTASLKELEALPGIGFVNAQTIITYRDTQGAFNNVDELANIPGLSPDLIDHIRDLVIVPAPVMEPVSAIPIDNEAILAEARKYMDSGQSALAVTKYAELVKKSHRLDTIILELQDALYRFPIDIDIWQTLGDAYVRNDNLQEALNAYTKAEELLR